MAIDFTDFTVIDTQSIFTVTSSSVIMDATSSNSAPQSLYLDFGAGALTDFEFNFESGLHMNNNPQWAFLVHNTDNNTSNIGLGPGIRAYGNYICLWNSGLTYILPRLNFPGYRDDNIVGGYGEAFFTFKRVGSTNYAYIWEDAAHTTLLGSASVTNWQGTTAYRYLLIQFGVASPYKYPDLTNRVETFVQNLSGPTSVVNATVTPDAINATAAVVAPTIVIVTNDTVSPDVVPASVTTNAPTVDVMFRAVFPCA